MTKKLKLLIAVSRHKLNIFTYVPKINDIRDLFNVRNNWLALYGLILLNLIMSGIKEMIFDRVIPSFELRK